MKKEFLVMITALCVLLSMIMFFITCAAIRDVIRIKEKIIEQEIKIEQQKEMLKKHKVLYSISYY